MDNENSGGSSLMLHFCSGRRLSIDIDIICPPGTDIERYWGIYARDYGFTLVEAVARIYRSDMALRFWAFLPL